MAGEVDPVARRGGRRAQPSQLHVAHHRGDSSRRERDASAAEEHGPTVGDVLEIVLRIAVRGVPVLEHAPADLGQCGLAPLPTRRARLHPSPPCMSGPLRRSEEHTSELQSLMRISYAVFCLKKKKKSLKHITTNSHDTKQ